MSGQPSPRPIVGQEAPDFVLPSTGNELVSLGSFRGETVVLLAFFPAAFYLNLAVFYIIIIIVVGAMFFE